VSQINVTIPASAPNGCWISLAAVAGGLLSNFATLPIQSGGGACFDPVTGLHGNQIAPPGQQTLRTGLVALTQSAGTTGVVRTSTDAAFESYTGVYDPTNSVSPGGCIVKYGVPPSAGAITGLDPGRINLSGPNGISLTLANQAGIKGAFDGTLAAGAIPQSGGTFTFQGTVRADVGSFTSTLTFTNPLLNWTNRGAAATIDRTQDFTATWTGGNVGSFVLITGSITTTATAGNPAGKGSTQLQNDTYLPLSAGGIDIGLTVGEVAIASATTYN
jgi:hypothetical protein